MRILTRKLVNIAVLVALVVLNGVAATGALSGVSIGELASRPASLLVPLGLVGGALLMGRMSMSRRRMAAGT